MNTADTPAAPDERRPALTSDGVTRLQIEATIARAEVATDDARTALDVRFYASYVAAIRAGVFEEWVQEVLSELAPYDRRTRRPARHVRPTLAVARAYRAFGGVMPVEVLPPASEAFPKGEPVSEVRAADAVAAYGMLGAP
jgi:hypothetical protein